MSIDTASMLSFILGNGSVMMAKQKQSMERVNRKLIMSSAMFWDSKKRVQKIKTLFLNSIGLKQFDDTDDFKIFELESIELLSLSKNQIIHLHPIAQLTSLVSLNVSFNKVYDLNPLTKLQKLQELYASNNDIKTVEPLKELKQLKTLQLFKNKIHNFKETFQTISCLQDLIELDIEENPVAEDQEFISVISSSFSQMKKLNGELNKSTQKIKQMSSSKGFMNTSMKGFGTTSMFFTANSSTFGTNIDAEKTFYNFCKKKSLTGTLYEKRKEKENILQKLENHYKQLDEQFEKEIVKNVRLKNRLYKMMQNKKTMENEKQDNVAKSQQTKLLKRKVKALKQQLFTKDKKGELLRKLFQVQMMAKSKQSIGSKESPQNGDTQSTQSEVQKLQQAINEIRWTRKFQADDVMVIETNQKYLGDEDTEINDLLGSIDTQIRELKSDIDYLS